MKHIPLLVLLVFLFTLLAVPTPGYANDCDDRDKPCAPRLFLKTTAIALTYSTLPSSPPTVSAFVTFQNQGNDFLRWRFYFGSAWGCAGESPVKWATILPETGFITPRQSANALLTVNGTMLSVGTHHIPLCMITNDPEHSIVTIPVTVTVK